MEFLKAFFGDKAITYDELVQAINAYNDINRITVEFKYSTNY